MSIKRLEFKNFQSLKNTSIDFAPGFTVIVGASDLGKSAAIRALKALVKNAPAPGLIRYGEKEFKVTATMDDDSYVSLTKGKNKSVFDVSGQEYPKAGVKAPEAVSNFWKIYDDGELNFASQHDLPFLLATPASGVAKRLGELTNASLLAAAIAEINKERLHALQDEKARTREAEELREEILSHKGLTARTKAVEAAVEALRAAQEAQSRLDTLMDLITSYEAVEEELASLEGKSVSLAGLDEALASALSAVTNLQALDDALEARKLLESQTVDVDLQATELKTEISDYENEIDQLIKNAGVCPLCGGETC